MGDKENEATVKKPIDKEYLKSSLKDFDSKILEKKYVQNNNEQLHTHVNKEVLDKLSTSDTGTLLYDGDEIGGSTSTNGKSAYEIAVEYGFEGTEQEWLESLNGNNGTNGSDGKDGINGSDGKSAYEVAVENGFEGTESEWLLSLKGETGEQGNSGSEGKSAYQIAVQNGFDGTELEWLNSLKGETGSAGEKGETGASGSDGLSAYQIAVNNGFDGTESEWLASLRGNDGVDGINGNDGKDGADGKSAFELAQENGFEGTEQEWLNSLKATATESEKTIYVTSKSIQYTGSGSKDDPLVDTLVFHDLPYTENNNWLLDIYVEPFTVSLVNASYENNTVSNPTSVNVSLDPSTCTSISNGDAIKIIGKIYLSELG